MLFFVCLFAVASMTSGSTANVSLPMDEDNPLMTPLIVNGRAYDISEVPYQVSLQYRGVYKCSGSIIGPRHILTAAHCIAGDKTRRCRPCEIRAGSSIYNAGGQLIKVIRFHPHPYYNVHTNNYDIAVLELAGNIVMGRNTKVVTLPSVGSPVPIGSYATVSGWGNVRDDIKGPTQLQGVSIPIQDPRICVRVFIDWFDRNTMICAASMYGGPNVCYGDSGGALVVNGVQYGVISMIAPPCAQPGYPGIFAHVANFRRFITKYSGGI